MNKDLVAIVDDTAIILPNGKFDEYPEITVFRHVGQHSRCTIEWLKDQKLGKCQVNADLIDELEDMGYDIKLVSVKDIIKRWYKIK